MYFYETWKRSKYHPCHLVNNSIKIPTNFISSENIHLHISLYIHILSWKFQADIHIIYTKMKVHFQEIHWVHTSTEECTKHFDNPKPVIQSKFLPVAVVDTSGIWKSCIWNMISYGMHRIVQYHWSNSHEFHFTWYTWEK